MRSEQRTRMENQDYQVPVTKHGMKKVTETRKVPKTVYVDVTVQVDEPYTYTAMEKRTRQVPIPYTVQVPETKYRTENYKEPVQRTKTVMDNVTKTVYDTVQKTRCVQQTKMVTKTIPVYNVIAKNPAPCPPGVDCGQGGGASMGADMGAAAAPVAAPAPASGYGETTTAKMIRMAPSGYNTQPSYGGNMGGCQPCNSGYGY